MVAVQPLPCWSISSTRRFRAFWSRNKFRWVTAAWGMLVVGLQTAPWMAPPEERNDCAEAKL